MPPWTAVKDDEGHIKVDETGKPLFTDGDKTVGFDMEQSMTKIAEVNNEAMTNRQSFEAATLKLSAFDGMNPEEAQAALKAAKDFEATKGKGEKIVTSMETEMTALKESMLLMQDNLKEKEEANLREKKTNVFANSEFIRDKTILTGLHAESLYGSNLSYDDTGKLVAKSRDGKLMMSVENLMETAGFEEAISRLVNDDPNGKAFIKTNGGGSGATGNKTITEESVDWANINKNPEQLKAMIEKMGTAKVQEKSVAAMIAKANPT